MIQGTFPDFSCGSAFHAVRLLKDELTKDPFFVVVFGIFVAELHSQHTYN